MLQCSETIWHGDGTAMEDHYKQDVGQELQRSGIPAASNIWKTILIKPSEKTPLSCVYGQECMHVLHGVWPDGG